MKADDFCRWKKLCVAMGGHEPIYSDGHTLFCTVCSARVQKGEDGSIPPVKMPPLVHDSDCPWYLIEQAVLPESLQLPDPEYVTDAIGFVHEVGEWKRGYYDSPD